MAIRIETKLSSRLKAALAHAEKKHPNAILSVWDEGYDMGEDEGVSYWASLAEGFVCGSTGTTSIHEFGVNDFANALRHDVMTIEEYNKAWK